MSGHLEKFIDLYVEGEVSEGAFLLGLANWNYKPMDTNSSPWESDMQYVEGSLDDVMLAVDQDKISIDLYGKLWNLWKEVKGVK